MATALTPAAWYSWSVHGQNVAHELTHPFVEVHFDLFKNSFVANAFISPFNTQTMHIKPFYTQQHCYVILKNLIPWRDSNPGLFVQF
jgi:hypothetical protein